MKNFVKVFLFSFCFFLLAKPQTVSASRPYRLVPNDFGTVLIETGNHAILHTRITKGYKVNFKKGSLDYKRFHQKLKVKSSNKKVATVNKYGVVTAKKVGKAKITIYVGQNKGISTHTWNIEVRKKIDPDDMFSYEIKKDSNGLDYIEITHYKANNTNLTIPAQIHGIPVKVFSAQMYTDLYDGRTACIKDIYFEDGITEIMDRSFAEVQTLESVHLPRTLEKLGNGVFSQDYRLKNINLEEIFDIGYIPPHTFHSCSSLPNNITIPGNVTEIGYCAFMGCSLENITFSEGLKEIGVSAFYCAKIKKLTIPSTVEKIRDRAFSYIKFDHVLNLSPNLEISPTAFENSLIPIGDTQFINGQLRFAPLS